MSSRVWYINMLKDVVYTFIAYLNGAAAKKFHFDDIFKQLNQK